MCSGRCSLPADDVGALKQGCSTGSKTVSASAVNCLG
jgi:hypothetical protein